MGKRNYTPRPVHQRPKRDLVEKTSNGEHFKGSNQNPAHLNYFGAKPTLHCGKRSCPALRRINEAGYLEGIGNHLDAKGVYGKSIREEVEEMFAQNELVLTQSDVDEFVINTPFDHLVEEGAKRDLKEKLDPVVYSAGINNLASKYPSRV